MCLSVIYCKPCAFSNLYIDIMRVTAVNQWISLVPVCTRTNKKLLLSNIYLVKLTWAQFHKVTYCEFPLSVAYCHFHVNNVCKTAYWSWTNSYWKCTKDGAIPSYFSQIDLVGCIYKSRCKLNISRTSETPWHRAFIFGYKHFVDVCYLIKLFKLFLEVK